MIEAHREQGGATQLEVVYNFADGLLSQTRYSAGVASTRLVHQDGFGSTRFLTDAAAAITDRWSYDAFGNEIAREGTTRTEHLYRGEQFDPNVGFYYLRARYYDGTVGRFSISDSFAGFSMDPSSLHKYAVNHNDPTNRVDPTGHWSIQELMQAVAVRALSLAITYPRTAAFLTFAINCIVPLEVQMASPQMGAFSGMTSSAGRAALHELSSVRKTLLQYGRGFWDTGLEFERWIAKALNISKSNLPVLNGQAISSNVRGSAVVDFIYRSSILEAKLSASTLTKNQAEQLAMYAQQNGLGLTYVFARRPSVADIERLERWVGSVAPGMEVKVNWIFAW